MLECLRETSLLSFTSTVTQRPVAIFLGSRHVPGWLSVSSIWLKVLFSPLPTMAADAKHLASEVVTIFQISQEPVLFLLR